jgi:hypothetical protein
MRTIKIFLLLTLLLPATGCKRITALFHGGIASSEHLISHVDILSSGYSRVKLANAGDKWLALANKSLTKQKMPYYEIGDPPIVSPDGRQKASVARVGEKMVVIINGKEGKSYDGIGMSGPIFSPDSQRVAYSAEIGKKWCVVVDGKESKSYDIIERPIFSPDSRRMAYVACVGGNVDGKCFIVADGEEKALNYGIDEHSLIFSPDSRRMAYVAHVGGKDIVMVDGKEGKTYDALPGRIVFGSANVLYYVGRKNTAVDNKSYDDFLVEETIY